MMNIALPRESHEERMRTLQAKRRVKLKRRLYKAGIPHETTRSMSYGELLRLAAKVAP